MKALSIQQPWAWLIVQALKDIENRDWTTEYRGLVLIHAGKRIDTDILKEMTGQWTRQTMPDHWRAAWAMMPENGAFSMGGIVGYATLQKVVTESDSPWFRGRYGFILTQRHPVDFIPLRGQLGLFDVPKEIEAQIDEIMDYRAIEAEAKDFNQIKKEWYEYAHEGDETPSYDDIHKVEGFRQVQAYNRAMDARNRIAAENREKPWLPLVDGE